MPEPAGFAAGKEPRSEAIHLFENERTMLWIGDQRITSLSAATALTVPGTGSGRANAALVTAYTKGVRIRRDGTPTASVGFPLDPGIPVWIFDDLANVSIIEMSASAEVAVIYYKR